MVHGIEGEVAFSDSLIRSEAERYGFDPTDTEGGVYLYPYANLGHVADTWQMDFWWACPASYARKNPSPAVQIAHAAIEAAQWIREGVPQWALDGTPPTPRMASLVQTCLAYWRIEEAEARAAAYDAAKNGADKP
jgi:hypothetical protein